MRSPILVLSHLRWNFVYQRPQHLLSRLAAHRKVIFIEEPLGDAPAPQWDLSEPNPNLIVARPRLPGEARGGYTDPNIQALRPLIADLISTQELQDYVLWLYTPMALPLARDLKPLAIVYDCMDELSHFLHAPPQLLDRERQLLELADIVFTGGPSLYRAKKDRHPAVHCFPSSVDAAHFGKAVQPGPDPADQAPLPHPRLGYFGVIDERMDIGLLDAIASAEPSWHIAMVGPTVKIDPATLPRHPNIHYFGQKDYQQLPDYLRGWDVCLLPFARNDSTRFISPTKTLEYMAAQKPIVSTPITDVAEPYGQIVYLGETHDQFIQACRQALSAPSQERESRAAAMRKVLSKTSWDTTARKMEELVEQVLSGKAPVAGAESAKPRPRPQDDSAPVVIIGAGPTGLSAAYHLGPDCLLLEKNESVGGWCRSIEDRGFTFDMAGHIMFSNDPDVHEMYKTLLGDNVHWQDREAWIYSKNVYTRYPFQGCLYGLPPEVITECIVGAIEARFGALSRAPELEDSVAKAANAGNGAAGNGNGHPKPNGHPAHHNGNGVKKGSPQPRLKLDERGRCFEGDVKDCCGDGVLEAQSPLVKAAARVAPGPSEGPPRNFEQFIYKVWGRGIARHFAIPYNRKLWAVPLSEMETSWLGGRVPMPDIQEMIRYALTPACKPMGPNARFGYPLRGGFQALMNGFLPHIQDQLRLNTAIASVSPERHAVTAADGRTFTYEKLISTMPLPLLIQIMGDQVPHDVRAAAAQLRHVSVRCVNIGVGRENLTDKHWIYYPEDTVFHRIFVQGNASPHCNPPGGFGLTCEITYAPTKPLPCDGDDLVKLCIEDCIRVGFFKRGDPIWAANQADLPYAYVVYDHNRPAAVKLIREWLENHDIILAGRYSEWEYYNSDHAFIAGRNAAQQARPPAELARSGAAPASGRV